MDGVSLPFLCWVINLKMAKIGSNGFTRNEFDKFSKELKQSRAERNYLPSRSREDMLVLLIPVPLHNFPSMGLFTDFKQQIIRDILVVPGA